MFSVEDKWILFKWRHLQFSAHACHGTPWECVERSGRRKEISPWNKYPLQYRKWKNRLTWKAQTVWRPVLRLELKIPCLLWLARWKKDRHAIIGTIPCVVITSLETDSFVAFVAYIDMLMVRSNLSAGSRKEGTQGTCAMYLKTQIQWFLFYGKLKNWDWTLRRDTPEFSGCTW